MHNDVTHAVKLMIKSELADPERIAIMGGSFGGYLALCGAAFEPELYKCAISVVGVFDWELAIKTDKQNENDYRRHTLLEKLGDPKETRDHFEEISPINHVDKIQIPIFIAHGKNDTNVSVLQSKKLRNKLKERGIPHETYFREWEGHGFVDDGNRLEFYKRIESFLDANL